MDVQRSTISNLKDHAEDYTKRVTQAVELARTSGVPVMFIVVRFRKGYPELSPNNKMFATIRERFASISMDSTNSATQPVVEPTADELVIAKKRVSAFSGSDLEMILNAQDIHHLILCGFSTSGVVLSTLRYAADKDYVLTVLSDCCADQDEEVHRVLLEKVFPRQATVLSTKAWEHQLKRNDNHVQ